MTAVAKPGLDSGIATNPFSQEISLVTGESVESIYLGFMTGNLPVTALIIDVYLLKGYVV